MKIIQFGSLTLACALGGSIAGGMVAPDAQAQTATVTGRVTNASGQPEVTNKPTEGCVLRPDGSCGEAQVTVREVNDPPACVSAGETGTTDQSRAIITSRSNIKRPAAAVEATEAPAGPPGAPVVTSRSNKKAGVAAVCEAGDALMQVSTTR
jgi:hypothetical protein